MACGARVRGSTSCNLPGWLRYTPSRRRLGTSIPTLHGYCDTKRFSDSGMILTRSFPRRRASAAPEGRGTPEFPGPTYWIWACAFRLNVQAEFLIQCQSKLDRQRSLFSFRKTSQICYQQKRRETTTEMSRFQLRLLELQ